ncbi:hypothetical protein FNV43_RR04788 [Rhamnella rubrinervis]|uniref:Myb-like domain-containing protein n=1 Tax=Rhamnella rubrinervis TaxID=2594499 RepID=A0A8K0MPW6_9ROSA|nr:hypothetical protein FNV43_RR04788 [Rhamnella rubrinervis]
MFDGVPAEQLHQFIASSRTSLPLSSFPLHANSSPNTFSINNSFDAYNSHHHQQVPLQPPPPPPPSDLLQPLHHQSPPAHKNHEDKQENNLVSVNERDRSVSMLEPINAPWTNDEVLALLRVRSNMENWFPDFTWEHISSKLAELGFKRSADKCKEKYEEESRYFNNINYMKNYRFLSELEELYNGDQNPHAIVGAAEKSQTVVEKPSHELLAEDKRGQSEENDQMVGKDSGADDQKVIVERLNSKKRKRSHKNFEIFKGYFEEIVNKMMAQQEEMHNKLLEEMLKRDEEKIAKEEAWKKQEMVRMNKELELMAHQQAIAGDRQSTIIEFLKKFTSSTSSSEETQHYSGGSKDENHSLKLLKSSSNPVRLTSSSSSIQAIQNPSPTCLVDNQNSTTPREEPEGHQNSYTTSTPSKTLVPQNPSSTLTPTTPKLPSTSSTSSPLASENPNSFDKPFTPTSSSIQIVVPQNRISNEKDDLGKRWPRDEVLALINLRCSLYSSSNEEKEGVKAPLWERISLGMLDLGYKRSAKRCKEKWENINKYFRKTKDVNKKRSMDSRTCPYFHQLSTLYNQGKIAAPNSQEQQSAAAAALPETCRGGSSQVIVGSSTDSSVHFNGDHHQGERNMVQVSAAFDFDF